MEIQKTHSFDTKSLQRQALRESFLAQRAKVSQNDRSEMSKKIIEQLVTLPIFQKKNCFFIYCSYRSEVETTLLLNNCLLKGKTVAVPLSVPEQSRLLTVAITDPAQDLFPGFRGIPEPIPSLVKRRLLSPESIEVVIVPGVVFARSGYRLGYGGGYYDRFLAQSVPQSYRIGLAFSLQLVDDIPVLPHDIPMDMVISEKEVIRCSRSSEQGHYHEK